MKNRCVTKCLSVYRFCNSLYNLLLKNIILYYQPIEVKLVFNNKNKSIKSFNCLKKYDPNKHFFIYKINDIDLKNGRVYNYGYYYHTSGVCKKIINNQKQAFPPDDIQSIKINLINSDNNEYLITEIAMRDKRFNFINDILPFVSYGTQLSVIIYYYLIKFLNIKNTINYVEFEINDSYYRIDHTKTISEIYNYLQNII